MFFGCKLELTLEFVITLNFFFHFSIYKLIVVTNNSEDPFPDTTLYPYTDSRWKSLGYYVTSLFHANNDDVTYTVGNRESRQYLGVTYYNSPLSPDVSYRVFIRLYSSATDPVSQISKTKCLKITLLVNIN